MAASPKSKGVDLALCALLGIFGAHRFYEGKVVTGVLYALSLGAIGVGAVADLIQIAVGVRTDKRGLIIGKRSNLPLRLTRIVSVVVAATVVFGSAALWLDRAVNGPVIADDYYTQIETRMPLESEFVAPGPQEVDEITYDSGDSAFDRIKVWFPTDIHDRSREPHPAVVVSNGSGTPFSRFEPALRHLASWGFIVIGNSDADSGNGRSSSLTLEFLLELNEDPDSELYRLVDVDDVGIAGHSQGAAGAINAATRYPNSDGFASLFAASTPSLELIGSAELPGWDYDLTLLDVPYFAVAGTRDADADVIAPLASMRENFASVPEGVPAVMGRRDGAGHGDMLTWADGYMTAWFRFTLMRDERAMRAFTEPAEIELNDGWTDVMRKGLD